MRSIRLSTNLFIDLIVGLVLICGVARAASPVSFERTINNPHPHSGDEFGFALSSYDDKLLVGGFGRDVYVMDPQTGAELLHIGTPETTGTPISFGAAVIQAGNRIVVGDHQADVGGFVRVGSAYVFDGLTGAPLLTIRNPTPQSFTNFGKSLESDAGKLFISSESSSTSTSGKVHVYDPLTGVLQSTLLNPQAGDGSWGFGASLEAHGPDLFVGAPGNRVSGISAGAVFRYDATTLARTLTINDPHPSSNSEFGWAMDSDATRLLVGAPQFGSSFGGEAYLFDAQSGALLRTIPYPESESNAGFGRSVALVGDYAVIGAPDVDFATRAGALNTGAFYVIDLSTGAVAAKVFDPAPNQNDAFTYGEGEGGLMRLGNRLLAVNRLKDAGSIGDAGAIHVYTLVPEPSSAGMVLVAGLLLSGERRRRNRRNRRRQECSVENLRPLVKPAR